jgi:high-affinity Fe2+/Pb2+ permease
MNLIFIYVLYGSAGLLFILAGSFAFRPLRSAVHRWGWIYLAIANLGLAGLMGVRIYLLSNPAPIEMVEILTGSLALLLALLALLASLVLGRRFLENYHSTQEAQKDRDRFQSGFDLSPHISILKDLQGVYQFTNQAYTTNY